MRIKQAYISEVLEDFWGKTVRKRYGFLPYSDPMSPAIFYGMYPPKRHRSGSFRLDLYKLENHKSLAIVVWLGSDAMAACAPRSRHQYKKMRKMTNVVHVAVSKSTHEDLSSLGIPCKFVPLCSTNTKLFYPTTLGKKVYVYTSFTVPQVYGWDKVQEVRKQLPDVEFIIGTAAQPGPKDKIKADSSFVCVARGELINLYSQCFVGLRLTPHDGLSNTVVELGLMGRRCIWDGWAPNAIPWTSVDDAVEAIRQEQLRISEDHPEVSEEMLNFIKVGKEWMHPGFWGLTVHRKVGRSVIVPRGKSTLSTYQQRKKAKKLAKKLAKKR